MTRPNPIIPTSLSPHICVRPSEDLVSLLSLSSLPPLPELLQSFSPLPQVTTRTISLTNVTHSFFGVRFSSVHETELTCKEDEEHRSGRLIDWITSRISQSCSRWIDEIESNGDRRSEDHRTPWWDDVRRCLEGDCAPRRGEGWNHPVCIVYAVSTTTPNPLQVLSSLYAAQADFPKWVDQTHFKCILIVHPANSSLSNEEVQVLFNAVKRQYGLQAYLLQLELPSIPPPPVPIPKSFPRLPSESEDQDPFRPLQNASSSEGASTIQMTQGDIQQTAQFLREFVVMSLIPWMEKCVVEWNEMHSSTRRLPSRLFSSTRRFFGTSASVPSAPFAPSSSSVIQKTMSGADSPTSPGFNTGSDAEPPSPQRRLAEFATILGDFKLATGVWEFLRKEGKGGADILPFLVAPSSTVPAYATQALADIVIQASDPSAHAQIRAITYAVRWEEAIGPIDFLSSLLQGDRMMAWAAGLSEEAPSALLLAQAALLCARRGAVRRAALWYHSAAMRLEKSGIKPLTMYLLRQCDNLLSSEIPDTLSPLFRHAECRPELGQTGFDAVVPGVEHTLGRLLYTTGDIDGAVRSFFGLLRGPRFHSPRTKTVGSFDEAFIDDFRLALEHLRATQPDKFKPLTYDRPFKFCIHSHIRSGFSEDLSGPDTENEEELESLLSRFRLPERRGQRNQCENVFVGVSFFVDLDLRNPLDAEVILTELTVQLKEAEPQHAVPQSAYDAEIVSDVRLAPFETRTVSVKVTPHRPAHLLATDVKYNFVSVLPCSEGLAKRGPRLHATAAQRRGVYYAPDIVPQVEVEMGSQRLEVGSLAGPSLYLFHGERRRLEVWVRNSGNRPITQMWLIGGSGVDVEVECGVVGSGVPEPVGNLSKTSNTIPSRQLQPIPLDNELTGKISLRAGEDRIIPIFVHATSNTTRQLSVHFVYTSDDGPFSSTRLTIPCHIDPLLRVHVSAEPTNATNTQFQVAFDAENLSDSVKVRVIDLVSVSPFWAPSDTLRRFATLSLCPGQLSSFSTNFSSVSRSTQDVEELQEFITCQLKDFLLGHPAKETKPPTLEMECHYLGNDTRGSGHLLQLAEHGRGIVAKKTLPILFPGIPLSSLIQIFPLFEPSALDFIVFWDLDEPQNHRTRTGYFHISGLNLGAEHATLQEVLETTVNGKAKRSIYAETARERTRLLEVVEGSKWNREMNPVHVSVHVAEQTNHDFSTGPALVIVAFILRNFSSTRALKYHLKLQETPTALSDDLSQSTIQFVGRLTREGILQPNESKVVSAQGRVARPGVYCIERWHIRCSVLRPPKGALCEDEMVQQTYTQSSDPERPCMFIVDRARNLEPMAT